MKDCEKRDWHILYRGMSIESFTLDTAGVQAAKRYTKRQFGGGGGTGQLEVQHVKGGRVYVVCEGDK